MSDANKQAMDERLNALFANRALMKFEPSREQVWIERTPLILSAVIIVVGLYWHYGWANDGDYLHVTLQIVARRSA